MQFRADGLLTSATRYPRFSGEPWTEEESRRGWYNYHRRVIDCETGFSVIKDIALLDKNGAVIAEKAYGHADMVEGLFVDLRESGSHRWPSGSEIFMACAAASNPGLLKQRTASLRKKQPLISSTRITADLAKDTSELLKLRNLNFDFDALQKKSPASAAALFDQLRLQYVAWRKSINKQHAPAAIDAARDAQTLREVNAALKNYALPVGGLRKLEGSVIEFEEPWAPPYGYRLPDAAMQATFATIVVRADCVSGMHVPLATNWLDADGKILLRESVTGKEALAELKRDYGSNHQFAPDVWQRQTAGMVVMPATLPYCALIHRATYPQAASGPDDGLPLGLTREVIAQEKTPEAMLLKVRAAWLTHPSRDLSLP